MGRLLDVGVVSVQRSGERERLSVGGTKSVRSQQREQPLVDVAWRGNGFVTLVANVLMLSSSSEWKVW